MMFEHMLTKILRFIALQVYQLTALFTLAMKGNRLSTVSPFSNIFKAGAICTVDNISYNYSLFDHAFQMTVYSGYPHCNSFTLKMSVYVTHCYMVASNRFQIRKKLLHLLCFILCFLCQMNRHLLNLKIISILLRKA